MYNWDLPWKGWIRQPQAPWLRTAVLLLTGAWRQGCIHQVQQVTVTETMRSPTSRAPPRREIFLYLPGRCQPCAHCLQKGLAREQSSRAPRAAPLSPLGAGLWENRLCLPRCDARSTRGCLALPGCCLSSRASAGPCCVCL